MDENPLVREFYQWKALLSYPEWRNFLHLLEEYAEFLQKEVNRCVRNRDLIGAAEFLAKMDDIPKILGKVKERIKTTQKAKKE